MTCCNNDCNQGRDCPYRRQVPPGGGFVIGTIIGLIMWAIIIAGVSVWLSGT
jgi:hypothetical protein